MKYNDLNDDFRVPYSYPILNALAVRDVFEVAGMAGVWNHIVFDPPQRLNEIIGNIAAVSFEVNCQALPHARQTSNVSVARDTSINSIRFPFHVDDRLQDVNLSLGQWHLRYIKSHLLSIKY